MPNTCRTLAQPSEAADGSEAKTERRRAGPSPGGLVNLIDQPQELVKLVALMDWPTLEQARGPKFESMAGRPRLPARLIAPLLHL
jgi:hypothetical protein